MKKIIALLLALAMLFTLAACQNGGPGATDNTGATNSTGTTNGSEGPALDSKGRYPAETVKIGFVNYDTTAELTLSIQRYFDYLDDYFNFEVIWSESLGSAEEEFAFIEQCASAGCKAIIGY